MFEYMHFSLKNSVETEFANFREIANLTRDLLLQVRIMVKMCSFWFGQYLANIKATIMKLCAVLQYHKGRVGWEWP